MKKKILFVILGLMLITILAGCSNAKNVNTNQPVTLTLWHNYGGQLKDTMDEMVDQFNETTGAEQGIIINVTSISGSAALHEKLIMAANGDPGAPTLPDITTAYPKTALILAEKDLLADLDQQFTPGELEAYVPAFIEEGRLNGQGLYVFPTAKSTEVLFVNQTIFDRFAKDTGAKLEDLKTFEGLLQTAALYYEWTDRQTPDILHDGKTFFMADSLFNAALIGCKQLGQELVADDTLKTDTPAYQKIWDTYYKSAVLGHTAIYDGYATDLAKTGDIVCSTGSTAGVSFFSPTVTYADNTAEPAELAILPYPVFENGRPTALQRGAGMCVTKSTAEKEHAAAVFLKWFTSPENNLHFVVSTGYMPVTQAAFGELMTKELENIDDRNIRKLSQAIRTMQEEYQFYTTPLFTGIDELQEQYEAQLKETAVQSRSSYCKYLPGSDIQTAYDAASLGKLEEFSDSF